MKKIESLQLKDQFSFHESQIRFILCTDFSETEESPDTLRRNRYFLPRRKKRFRAKARGIHHEWILFAKLEAAMRQKIKPDPLGT